MSQKKLRLILAANWKMNPSTLEEGRLILRALDRTLPPKIDLIVFPPSIFFSALQKMSGKIRYGLQNIHFEQKGACTGEISARMAKGAGARYVLVGHSERRSMGETNEEVAKKLRSAVIEGLTPIFCFGERERDDHGGHFHELQKQIEEGLSLLSARDISDIIFAYEPVWAIGKEASQSIRPHDLHEASLFVRKVVHEKWKTSPSAIRILYGGAVEEDNVSDLLAQGDIDGFLIGHKSLDPKAFAEILRLVGGKRK